MEKTKQRLIELLVEAHSNELALINTLEAHIRIAQPGSYRSLLQAHLKETRQHADLVQRRLDRLGWRRSLRSTVFSGGYGVVQNVVKQGLVLAKGPIDMVRGGTNINEKMLRNARDEAMTEGMEIGAYDTIESIARSLGDHETAELAATIRLDEEQMFEALRKEIPILAHDVARGDVAAGQVTAEPWPGYDEQPADEVVKELREGTESLALAVIDYEKANKNRSTVLNAAEGQIGASV